VLDILIAAFERNIGAEPNGAAAIAAYRSMRADIAREKAVRTPGRIIDALNALRSEDPGACAERLPRLRQWLSEQDGGAATSHPG